MSLPEAEAPANTATKLEEVMRDDGGGEKRMYTILTPLNHIEATEIKHGVDSSTIGNSRGNKYTTAVELCEYVEMRLLDEAPVRMMIFGI
jgi:hypothetical protein